MILVTGANGLVGSFLCRELKKENIPFKGLVRENSDLTLLESISDDLIFGNFLDVDFIAHELPNFNAIVHCAAVVSFDKNRQQEMFEVNVTGTKQLVDVALKSNIDYFLHLSSVAAIGRSSQNDTINENNDWTSSQNNTYYGESKHLAELEVWRGIQEGLNASMVNPSVILAPGDWNKSSAKLFKYVWDETPFYGKGSLNYVDIRDVTSVILALLRQQVCHERFIVSAGAVSYKSFFNLTAGYLGKKPPKVAITKWIGIIALFFSQLKTALTSGEPMVTKETLNLANSTTVFDNSKVKKRLNFQFKDLNDTLKWSTDGLKKRMANN